jgi:hypothetical protein
MGAHFDIVTVWFASIAFISLLWGFTSASTEWRIFPRFIFIGVSTVTIKTETSGNFASNDCYGNYAVTVIPESFY